MSDRENYRRLILDIASKMFSDVKKESTFSVIRPEDLEKCESSNPEVLIAVYSIGSSPKRYRCEIADYRKKDGRSAHTNVEYKMLNKSWGKIWSRESILRAEYLMEAEQERYNSRGKVLAESLGIGE